MKNLPKSPNDLVWWGITVVLICIGIWPIAFVIGGLNLAGKLPTVTDLLNYLRNKKGTTQQKVSATEQQTAQPTAKKPVEQTVEPVTEKTKNTAKSRSGKELLREGKTEKVLGILMSFISAFWAMGSIVYFADGDIRNAIAITVAFLLHLAGTVALFVSGNKKKKRKNRITQLLKILRPGQNSAVSRLAALTGTSEKETIRDLEKMLECGMLSGDAWLDHAENILRYDLPTEEAPENETSESDEPLDEERILKRIRDDNDMIADPVISAKIYKLEAQTQQLLTYRRQHPDQAGQLRTFLNYYLPQTMKLLETYAALEKENYQGSSADDLRARISGALDQLSSGYQKLIEKLLSSQRIDITADIQVMEQMLERDGLSEPELMLQTLKN